MRIVSVLFCKRIGMIFGNITNCRCSTDAAFRRMAWLLLVSGRCCAIAKTGGSPYIGMPKMMNHAALRKNSGFKSKKPAPCIS